MTDTIVVAAPGGFLAWVLGHITASIVLRRRLLTSLTTVLNIHSCRVRDHQSWLQQVINTSIVAGAPFFTKSDLADLSCLRDRYLQYLFKSELIKLAKCTQCLWKIEALFDGFCRSLLEAQTRREPLRQGQVDFFRRRAQRIDSHIKGMPEKLKSLRDLPDDYAGKISAAALVVPPEVPDQEDADDERDSESDEAGRMKSG